MKQNSANLLDSLNTTDPLVVEVKGCCNCVWIFITFVLLRLTVKRDGDEEEGGGVRAHLGFRGRAMSTPRG